MTRNARDRFIGRAAEREVLGDIDPAEAARRPVRLRRRGCRRDHRLGAARVRPRSGKG
ncbi:hypothetical protein AB5J62_17745 [Amycolatopsis sp. cg5]|uniref:hypothetical protein n=1 Tax=Amycolatopsis sp. cg5 TaxID=3238802 RepID=UPI0035257C07